MNFRTLTLAAMLSVTALSGAAFAQENPEVGGAAMFADKNIVENAVNSADHTTLVAAVQAAGLVERSGHDRCLVGLVELPEQRRTAGRTETAPGEIRRAVPCDFFGTLDGKTGVGDIGCGIVVTGLLAALRAVAIDDAPQRPCRGETHRAAKT